MILKFMTKRNGNGWRRWLAIDTDKRVYTTLCPHFIPDGIEVSTTAIREIKNQCTAEGYTEVNDIREG